MVGMAQAQSLESALMPGAVIKGHVEAEHECSKCHVRGERAAQPALCLACHKPVAADVKSGQGYHGRLKDKTCRSCHTEHKGRDAKIIALDTQHFDHSQIDFMLKGKHQGKNCNGCHRSGELWRNAPAECAGCHRKDDKHKGGLGEKCANCHNEHNWKDARFDHNKTKFLLKLSHVDVKCSDCHLEQRYTNTARECLSCHRTDDAHKGAYGAVCEKCHSEGDWKQPSFRHDRDTHFPLLDKHRGVKCESCHKSAHSQSPMTSIFREKTPTRCVACHRNDDVHKGNLGDKCEACHAAKGWKNTRFDHDLDTKFPLKEKHAKVKCQSCHKTEEGKGTAGQTRVARVATPTNCYACHEKDDQEKEGGHRGRYGKKCETCHTERGFKYAHFDHDGETTFKILGRHQKIRCDACHRTPLYSSPKTNARCVACHEKEDVHFTSYGTDCESCHSSEDWRKIIKREKTEREHRP